MFVVLLRGILRSWYFEIIVLTNHGCSKLPYNIEISIYLWFLNLSYFCLKKLYFFVITRIHYRIPVIFEC